MKANPQNENGCKRVQVNVIESLQTLDQRLKSLCANSRKLEAEILQGLHQAEKRMLYAELGYPSLWEYSLTELRMSESEAGRRISAMRACRDLPIIQQKLTTGELSLTNLARAQKYFRAQEKSAKQILNLHQREAILIKLENLTTRQAEARLATHFSDVRLENVEPEKVLPLSDGKFEVRLIVSSDLKSKLDYLKARLSHKNPNMTYLELIETMAAQALKKFDGASGAFAEKSAAAPAQDCSKTDKLPDTYRAAPEQDCVQTEEARQKAENVQKRETAHMLVARSHSPNQPDLKPREPKPNEVKSKKRSRAISPKVRLEVWRRDHGRCTYIHSSTGKQCSATHLLQLDHRIPWALDGENTSENLRLRCRAHNIYAAVKTYGMDKIKLHVASL